MPQIQFSHLMSAATNEPQTVEQMLAEYYSKEEIAKDMLAYAATLTESREKIQDK